MTRKYPFSCTNLAIRLLLPHCNKCLQCAFGIQIVQHYWLGSSKLGMIIIYSKCIAVNTALDYKPRILGPTLLVYVLKWSVISTSLALKNGVKNIQTAGYNGACTVVQHNWLGSSKLGMIIIYSKFIAANTKQGQARVVIHGQNGPAYLLLAKKRGGKFCFLKSFGSIFEDISIQFS